MAEDEALCAAVECADAVFREFAEMTAANDGKTFEEAYTVTWRLYEVGDLKLVGEGGRLRVRACITRTEAACCREAKPAIGCLPATARALEPTGTGARKPARTKQPLEPDRGRAGWIE